jgi:hypothetical protein
VLPLLTCLHPSQSVDVRIRPEVGVGDVPKPPALDGMGATSKLAVECVKRERADVAAREALHSDDVRPCLSRILVQAVPRGSVVGPAFEKVAAYLITHDMYGLIKVSPPLFLAPVHVLNEQLRIADYEDPLM